MPDDRFESRLRALAQQLSRSISEVDLDEVADRLGVDPDRVRGAAGVVEGWLSDHADETEPLFSSGPGHPHEYEGATELGSRSERGSTGRAAGPHPLDMPTDDQGRALSALASGRWSVRPGSGQLSNTEPAAGPAAPAHSDLTGELRARDWIAADGAVTLVGREALLRWCRSAEAGSNPAAPGEAAPGQAAPTQAAPAQAAPDEATGPDA